MPNACVLISDITGSTGLYEKSGNQFALEQVSKVLARMRQMVEQAGGKCVKSQGDDILAFFESSEIAFQVAWSMIQENWPQGLSVHSGTYFGEILNHENDIYGSAVNTAARLCALAKPGEIMVGDLSYDDLSPDSKSKLQMLGEIQLRGKVDRTRVYSCSAMSLTEQTVISPLLAPKRLLGAEFAEFKLAGQHWQIAEGQSLTVGRIPECDITIDQSWVSRKHAVFTIVGSQLEIKDHSSYGSVIEMTDGSEILLHRRGTLLSGTGSVFFGPKSKMQSPDRVSFTVHGQGLDGAVMPVPPN
jgi:adenylate cyclase